ncbi:MAG: hypothetical protein IPK26_02115 [Planctomycetes bacterium]|nr:hypothetical protein [Planctomycetota bacterium]
MKTFRFSLAAAMVKRRGAMERAEASRQRAAVALEQQQRGVVDLQERLQLAELRQHAARLALAEPTAGVVEAMTELAQYGRMHAAIATAARLRTELELGAPGSPAPDRTAAAVHAGRSALQRRGARARCPGRAGAPGVPAGARAPRRCAAARRCVVALATGGNRGIR